MESDHKTENSKEVEIEPCEPKETETNLDELKMSIEIEEKVPEPPETLEQMQVDKTEGLESTISQIPTEKPEAFSTKIEDGQITSEMPEEKIEESEEIKELDQEVPIGPEPTGPSEIAVRPDTSSSIENSDYFVDSDDDLSHSSLDSELEDAELLRLIDNLDSD